MAPIVFAQQCPILEQSKFLVIFCRALSFQNCICRSCPQTKRVFPTGLWTWRPTSCIKVVRKQILDLYWIHVQEMVWS